MTDLPERAHPDLPEDAEARMMTGRRLTRRRFSRIVLAMARNIKNNKVERLAEELAHMTGESRTTVILRALEEQKKRIAAGPAEKRRLAQALDFLEKEVWPNIPRKLLGRRISKKERERILGYGRGGV